MLHVVGWEQDVNPKLQIAGGLTQSESGLTYQAAHPMCTLGMVNALIPSEWDAQIKAWRAADIIRKGEIRKHGGYYWKAKKNSQGQEPPANDFNGDFNEDFGNEYWLATNLLTEKVEQLTRRGIQNAVQRWMQTKKVNKESRTLLERRVMFDGAGRLQNTTPNRDKICGFELASVKAPRQREIRLEVAAMKAQLPDRNRFSALSCSPAAMMPEVTREYQKSVTSRAAASL